MSVEVLPWALGVAYSCHCGLEIIEFVLLCSDGIEMIEFLLTVDGGLVMN